MSEDERFFLYDETEETKTRYVSFMGVNNRFDLAIMKTERFFGKQLVLNIQSGRFAVIGADDINEPGYLEHAYNINEEDAEELRSFLLEIT
jgi:hypothetical protein